jgi:hypothetical protein
MHRIPRTVALAFVAVAWLGSVSDHAIGAGASLCSVAFAGPQGESRQCFVPSRADAGERVMSVATVPPIVAIRKSAHLPLTQVAVRSSGRPVEILFLFGSLPSNSTGLPDLSSNRHLYLLVGEQVGHVHSARRLYRDGTGGGRYYWEYQANFACHNLTLIVDSNENQGVVRQASSGVLNLERCSPNK